MKRPLERRRLPESKDDIGKNGGSSYDELRCSCFKYFPPGDLYTVASDHAFPFLQALGTGGSTYAQHLKGCAIVDSFCGAAGKVVDLLDVVPMDDRDTKGDVYEYLLGKIATAGQNWQFRTPRHIIQLLKGCVAAVRNRLAHGPMILWQGEDDAAYYLALISLLHRKLDDRVPTQMR